MYLAYDIRGIQQFIFSVPKLKCMIGASGLIVEFDRFAESKAKELSDIVLVFARGGRGAFECGSDSLAELRSELIREATEFGMDIRFGQSESFSDAMNNIDQLHPCIPKPIRGNSSLEGFPCQVSGLWPVPEGSGKGNAKDVHPIIWHRLQMAQQDVLGRMILRELQTELSSDVAKYQLEFFNTVNADDGGEGGDPREQQEGRAGAAALGKRNRWAVVVMDGNDIGEQFNAQAAASPDVYKKISDELHACTRGAFAVALSNAINQWAEDMGAERLDSCRIRDSEDRLTDRLVLPFRPLILGGDDLTLLCHSSYALQFVRGMSEQFNEFSKRADLEPLWPGTNGELTISAGILYCKVSFPLHMAIPYAGDLLDNAKGVLQDREVKAKPAAVDWDHITDTLVTTPERKRDRELRFFDGELSRTVHLTRRPYLLQPHPDAAELRGLINLADDLERSDIAPSTLAQLYPRLRKPWSDRVAFLASLGKRHPHLMDYLWEAPNRTGDGWILSPDKDAQYTDILDAVMVLEERHRMKQTTTGN